MEDKTCSNCGCFFTPKKLKQKYCSVGCANEAQRKTGKADHICLNCGEKYAWSDGHPHKFCSRDCWREWQKAHRVKKVSKEKITYTRKCECCGKEFSTKISNQKYCSLECRCEADSKRDRDEREKKYISRTYVCKECGTVFTTKFTDTHSVFCCKSCAEKHDRRIEHQSERHRKYMRRFKSQREKQIRDNFVENVSYNSIYKRDRGICQICGLPVVYDKHADNNWSGTIDHIVPVSLNGEHSMKNCQLAHRLCNSLKSNNIEHFTIDWEQKSQENNYWAIRYKALKDKLGA